MSQSKSCDYVSSNNSCHITVSPCHNLSQTDLSLHNNPSDCVTISLLMSHNCVLMSHSISISSSLVCDCFSISKFMSHNCVLMSPSNHINLPPFCSQSNINVSLFNSPFQSVCLHVTLLSYDCNSMSYLSHMNVPPCYTPLT